MKRVCVFLLAFALVGCLSSGSKEVKTADMAAKPKVAAAEQAKAETVAAVETAAAPAAEAVQAEGAAVFAVYSDKNAETNHFIPSGWMGDYGDIKLNDNWTENPHSGSSCIKIEYGNAASQGSRWAGVYWQYPENNWGNLEPSYDLSGKARLTFWVRGEKGNEQIQEFKVGGITGQYPDSDSASMGPITLTADWQQYTIDLGGKNLSRIIGGFAWSTNIDVNPEGAVFYLDDIQFEQ